MNNSTRNNRNNRSNSTTTRIMNYYSSGGANMASVIFVILIVITLAVISYYAYTIYYKKPVAIEKDIISSIVDTKIQYNIAGSNLPTSQYSNEYTISMWLKVNDYAYRYGDKKVILRRGTGESVNPEISLGKKDNNLTVQLGLATQQKNGSTSRFVDIATEKFKNMDQMLIQQGDDDYNRNFGAVSNNDVVPLNKICPWIENADARYEGTSITLHEGDQVKYLLETFDNNPDLVDALSSMLISICKFFNIVEDPETAKLILAAINSSLDKMDITNKDTGDTSASSAIDDFFLSHSDNPTITRIKVEKDNYKAKLSELANLNPSNEDIIDSIPAINDALAKANCSIVLDAADITNKNKLKSILQEMVKKMYYQVMYNLGVAVAEQHGNDIKMYGEQLSDKIGGCSISKFPLQRWTHLAVCVMNQNVNLYQDGQLVSSCVMRGFPQIQTGDVVLFPDGGFSGQMTKLMYSNMALNQEQIASIYSAGPQTSSSFWEQIPNWLLYVGISLISMLVVLMIVS